MFSTINLTEHFEKIDTDGWTHFPLPNHWGELLENAKFYDSTQQFKAAGVSENAQIQENIRNDKIHWLSEKVDLVSEVTFLKELNILRQQLKEYFRIGLNQFECHYAQYPAGHFYHRHSDQKSKDNKRFFSFVYYLNPDWRIEDGGQLVAYTDHKQELFRLNPTGGTFVIFRSDIEHEVLTAHKMRWSIAGWMRTT